MGMSVGLFLSQRGVGGILCWSLRAPIGNYIASSMRVGGVLSLFSVILKPGGGCLYSLHRESQIWPLVGPRRLWRLLRLTPEFPAEILANAYPVPLQAHPSSRRRGNHLARCKAASPAEALG